VAFGASTSVSGNGIFAGTPGSSLSTVALGGTAAPNCGGATFNGNITFVPVINASEQVAFLGTLTIGSGSPPVIIATDQGLFAGAPGSLVLVVRKADVVDVDPTAGVDDRTVSANNFPSFNDSGELAYQLHFTDGSSGIFTSDITVVPEPGTLALVGAAAVGGWAVRRRQCRGRPHRIDGCLPASRHPRVDLSDRHAHCATGSP
jgi:hypothetical protein